MQLAEKNSLHIIEATIKAFARALRQATEYDPRRRGTVPRFEIILTYHCSSFFLFLSSAPLVHYNILWFLVSNFKASPMAAYNL